MLKGGKREHGSTEREYDNFRYIIVWKEAVCETQFYKEDIMSL
jgi:hypothetical protein